MGPIEVTPRCREPHASGTFDPAAQMMPTPVTATLRSAIRYLAGAADEPSVGPPLPESRILWTPLTISPTVRMLRASSSGMEILNLLSSSKIRGKVSRESTPRSCSEESSLICSVEMRFTDARVAMTFSSTAESGIRDPLGYFHVGRLQL